MSRARVIPVALTANLELFCRWLEDDVTLLFTLEGEDGGLFFNLSELLELGFEHVMIRSTSDQTVKLVDLEKIA